MKTVVALLAALLLVGCASVAPAPSVVSTHVALPDLDRYPILSQQPIAQCSETGGVYSRVRDLNPDTKAAAVEYGWFAIGPMGLLPLQTVAILFYGDDGNYARGVASVNGKIVEYPTLEGFMAAFPVPCDLPAMVVDSPAGRS